MREGDRYRAGIEMGVRKRLERDRDRGGDGVFGGMRCGRGVEGER